MSKLYEIKTIDGGVKDVDTVSRRVKTAWNKTTIQDSDKDIIEKTAFDKTIKERGPRGKNLIWHLTDHRASLKDAVGKPQEIAMEDDLLVAITEIPKTNWGNDVLELYKSGAINQHSIGFATVKSEIINEDDFDKRYQVLKEVTLYEGSAVLWAANEFTPTLWFGKSLNELTEDDRKSEFQKTMDDLQTFYKLFKTGHLTDETFELVELKILQITNKIQQLFEETTQPVLKTVEPDSKGLLDVFKTFNNDLKTAYYGRETIESAA